MKYAAEMGSSIKTYIPNFIEIRSSAQKLMGRGIYIHRQQGDLISILLFFVVVVQNKES
jgi:hypothetical protein